MKKTIFLILSTVFLCLPSFAQISDLALGVMDELGIDLEAYNKELIVEKVIPNSKNESIIVIPEIVDFEDEYYLSFNSHILIVDNKSGVIKSKFFESHETNDWYSDAVVMQKITIDTAPYYLQKGKRAFGVRVFFHGSSRVNPFSYEMLSLFVPNEDKIDMVLKNLTVQKFSGEWDGYCEGEFADEASILIMDSEKTNDYYNIIVVNNIIIIKNEFVNDDDCVESTEPKKVDSFTYKFVDGMYQKIE